MTRTPPLHKHDEKSTATIKVACTPTEKLLWQMTFGQNKLADTVRILLNQKAKRMTR